jgi:hypothetical protein
MEILFLTTVLPSGRSTGGEIASQDVIDGLRATGHTVTIVGYRRPGETMTDEPGSVEAGRRPIETADAGPTRALAWTASALIRRIPYSAAKYRSSGYRRAAGRLVGSGRFDLAVVDHAQAGWIAPELRRARLPFVLFAHNVEHEIYAERAARARGIRRRLELREQRLVKRLEEGLARAARAVWALTDDDAARFRAFGTTRTLAVPAGARASVRDEPKRCDVALLGTWTWGVTRSSLEWFLERVHPRLPEGLTVEVAGRGAAWIDGAYPGVRYRGFVPDALGFLAASRVVAVPSLGGTGVQVKTLDAIASGARVVASPPAVRGLASPPSSVYVAHTAEDFAREVERLATDAESLTPSREGIEWTRARRERFRADVEAAAAAVAVVGP